MTVYATISLAEARRTHLASCTTAMPIAMPIGGFIAWTALAVVAAAAPLPPAPEYFDIPVR